MPAWTQLFLSKDSAHLITKILEHKKRWFRDAIDLPKRHFNLLIPVSCLYGLEDLAFSPRFCNIKFNFDTSSVAEHVPSGINNFTFHSTHHSHSPHSLAKFWNPLSPTHTNTVQEGGRLIKNIFGWISTSLKLLTAPLPSACLNPRLLRNHTRTHLPPHTTHIYTHAHTFMHSVIKKLQWKKKR